MKEIKMNSTKETKKIEFPSNLNGNLTCDHKSKGNKFFNFCVEFLILFE